MATTETAFVGAGEVLASDYRFVKWVGTTKAGKAVTISLPKAICLSDPDWTMAEKDDMTAEIEFSGVYEDTKLASGDRTEPWKISYADGTTAGTGEIILRAGKFYVGATEQTATLVGLTRGGGSFNTGRAFREINADDDPGPVEGRIVMDEGRPKLKFTALQWLTKVNHLYSGIKSAT